MQLTATTQQISTGKTILTITEGVLNKYKWAYSGHTVPDAVLLPDIVLINNYCISVQGESMFQYSCASLPKHVRLKCTESSETERAEKLSTVNYR